jgi:hypothetical protein
MIKDYKSLKIGDRVRFSLVRDRRFHPERVEYLKGTVIRESFKGWWVRTSTVTMAKFSVTEANYIGHTTPIKRSS